MTNTSERDERDRPLWQQATNLPELGELTARWLEGDIRYLPAYYGSSPDEETAELILALAVVNRGGLVTDFSQPGEPFDGEGGQRAAVTGFCSEELATKARRLAAGSDLIVLAYPPLAGAGCRIVVTMDGGKEFTWIGMTADAAELAYQYGEDLSRDGLLALQMAWQLHVVDPRWGRTELLRDFLGALGSP